MVIKFNPNKLLKLAKLQVQIGIVCPREFSTSASPNFFQKRTYDKVALVTGAGSGIGRAASIILAKHGAKVAVTDINEENGHKVVEEIISNNGIAHFCHMDVSKETSVKQAVDIVSKKFGRINVLVNNAGITGVNKPTHEVTEEEWDKCMSVNTKGPFFCTKHVVPHMMKGGGSIINISSVYGIIGGPDVPPYHASKAALWMMTKVDALLYAQYGIRVNSIHPGTVKTPLGASMGLLHPDGVEGFFRDMAKLHPISYVGEPEDIAYTILHLASDESKFTTGAAISVDGGYALKSGR
jgi:NAD(P)-dependent dehydrogenase (short-subunit alcohol dehydrogenase family)